MERVYKIKIKGPVTEGMKIAMGEGLELDDASAGAHEYAQEGPMSFAPFYAYQVQKDQGDYSILKVAIGEGQNRELRRFFAHFGAEIVDLKRLSFGGIELNNLPTGKVRFLERSEYTNLREFLDTTEKAAKQKQKEIKKAIPSERKTEKKSVETKPVKKEEKKPTKREFVKDKKPKPQNEVFGTNKYKPKTDSKFKK
jgi:23S rRNA pseudouridine2605 synthase